MLLQAQIPDHLGVEQADGVAGGGIAKPRVEFLGDGGAAEHAAAFENPHAEP